MEIFIIYYSYLYSIPFITDCYKLVCRSICKYFHLIVKVDIDLVQGVWVHALLWPTRPNIHLRLVLSI